MKRYKHVNLKLHTDWSMRLQMPVRQTSHVITNGWKHKVHCMIKYDCFPRMPIIANEHFLKHTSLSSAPAQSSHTECNLHKLIKLFTGMSRNQ